MDPIIVWFRRDLRIEDNRALAAAAGRPVIPLYILDDHTPGDWKLGGASRWWLDGSLKALAADLKSLGSRLILRRGEPIAIVSALAAETGASAVHATRAYEPWASALEAALKTALEKEGRSFKRYAGALLFEPEAVRTKLGEPFKVYTPFWRAATSGGEPTKPVPAPSKLIAPAKWPASDKLDAWGLLPKTPDWAGGMRAAWTPGGTGARKRLDTFLSTALADYTDARNRPDLAATSRLSPHLAFGEISPNACWHAAKAIGAAAHGSERGLETFLKELAWREFSYHLLAHWPTLPEAPFKPEFAHFPWAPDAAQVRAWQRGMTGYPIIDAGMRELWTTGWMHNRVRMIAASFLIKNLLVPWQTGEAWFWDTLVDADLASNSASWQWVAGSGADAAPYFRIFNPVVQGAKFDAGGAYVRRYVPELARLPDALIHTPWDAPREILAAAGVTLGKTYPSPIVDLPATRDRALAALATLKSR